MLEESQYSRHKQLLLGLAQKNAGLLKIGVGDALRMDHIKESYHSAKIAVKSLGRSFLLFAVSDDLGIEVLAEDISDSLRARFTSRVLDALDASDEEMLLSYFRNDLSLKETSAELNIHRNTLQYQLNRISDKTGFDPRYFPDAVNLYMALLLKK